MSPEVACDPTFSRRSVTHGAKGEVLRDDPPDDELVRAFVRDGDEDAFRCLYGRHTPVLFRLALRLLGGHEPGAEDAVQETWIRAAEGLTGFRFESSLRTWLVGILLNCGREARRRSPSSASEPPEEPWATPAVGEKIDLERAIAGLAEGYRQVFVFHDLLGYTHREIASQLGVDEGTSKSQLFLARRALRRRMGSITRGSP